MVSYVIVKFSDFARNPVVQSLEMKFDNQYTVYVIEIKPFELI